MASNSKEVVTDLSPYIKVYKDGSVERLMGSSHVPPSIEDAITGVSSKDIRISPNFSARLYLPKINPITDPNQQFPILVYFHGGGFFLESAFSFLNHRYVNLLVSKAKALAISVEYRLAPEHPLPAAYEDSWETLQWVGSHVVADSNIDKDPWLISHGNFDKLYIGGDSAGSNIVHNIALRAGVESLVGDMKILGGILSHPFFVISEAKNGNSEASMVSKVWNFVYPSAPGGIDNPMINPLADDAPNLSGIVCSKLFVWVAGKDALREVANLYVEAVKKSGWKGDLEFMVFEGENYCFHISNPDSEKAISLVDSLASFIKD